MKPEDIKNGVEGEEVPIQVTEEVEIGSLADVKEERTLIPPTKAVKVRIDKVEVLMQGTPQGAYRQLRLTTPLVEGVEVVDEGEAKMKYKNFPIRTDVCYYADTTLYTKDWFKKNQHLVQYKFLLQAIGKDIKDPAQTKMNDNLIADLSKKEVVVDIKQEPQKPFTAKDGTEVVPGPRNVVKNFKAVSETDGV